MVGGHRAESVRLIARGSSPRSRRSTSSCPTATRSHGPSFASGSRLLEREDLVDHRAHLAARDEVVFKGVMPALFYGLPPDTGKPRHWIGLENGEPWLRKALEELREFKLRLA
jgi:hypothetical protein